MFNFLGIRNTQATTGNSQNHPTHSQWHQKNAIFLIVFLAFLLIATPVYAIANPDNVDIPDRYVNRNILETGDMLLYGKYYVNYASVPDKSIDEAFYFQLLDTDGSTILATDIAYNYYNSGYGYGVFSFYFTAAQAPTWSQVYTIRVSGNPSAFTDIPVYDFTLTLSDYTASTSTEDNQDEIYENVIDLANDLEDAWSVTLLTSGDTKTVLDADGEQYFRKAIGGLQALAPDLFQINIGDPTYDTYNWTTNQATTYAERFDGTWIGDAIDDNATLFNINSQMISGGFIVILAIIAMIYSASKFNTTLPGFIGGILVVSGGFLMGWVAPAILGIFGILCVLYIGYFFFFQRA